MLDTNGKSDRRRSERIKDSIYVFCRSEEKILEQICCVTEDISVTGIKMVSNSLFSPKDLIEIEIYQPYNLKKNVIMSLMAIGEIAWTKEVNIMDKNKLGKGYYIGVKFLEVEDTDVQVIKNYLWLKNKEVETNCSLNN